MERTLHFLHDSPHRRLNPLTGEWVLVSPHRTERPWRGQTEPPVQTSVPQHDPDCYLCPGSTRAKGEVNPPYEGALAFDNDFPALRLDAPTTEVGDEIIVARGEPGVCRVICYSPRHDLTLSRMATADIARLVEKWRDESMTLGAIETVNYVQIFENRGEMMGASNPHPHCQIWATNSLPNEIEKEARTQRNHMALRGPAFCAIIWRANRRNANVSLTRTKASSRWFHFGRAGHSKPCCSPSVTWGASTISARRRTRFWRTC